MTGTFLPVLSSNAQLIGTLIPRLKEAGHELQLFSYAYGAEESGLPGEYFGVPVHWTTDRKRDWKRELLYPGISKAVDKKGFSDALQVQIFLREMKQIRKEYPYEAVVSTSEPYPMAVTAARIPGVENLLYLMDPPACVSNGRETPYRNRTLKSVLRCQDFVLTTPFIKKALREHGLPEPKKGFVTVGFPMISSSRADGKKPSDGKIRLLYCGWLYSDIRSPRYFLDIVSRLDERFEITFMGRECETLRERFPIETNATIITLPNQPYEVAQQAMADADILINIGNSVPVHMPSKTLEYINTGKPMVNFYKLEDCPTLYYTKRYPLALNLFEGEAYIDAAADTFVRFCEENRRKTVNREWILREYADCTPEYIARKILDCLEN